VLRPIVASKWIVFREPKGAYLREKYSGSPKLTGEIWDLTELAYVTLKMCDGTKNVREILEEVSKLVGNNIPMLESAGAFIVGAVEKGILVNNNSYEGYHFPEHGSAIRYFPMHLAIELTDKCNLRCGHCYRDSGPNLGSFLPKKRLLSILSEAYDYGVQSIELSGGEPTIHPDIDAMLDFTLQNFGAVALLTNGTRITDSICDLLVSYNERSFVQIDLDGPTALEHDSLRGIPGSFEKAVCAIARLSKNGVRVRVAMSLHRGNVDTIEQTYELACNLGAHLFLCSPVMAIGRATEEMVLPWDDLKRSSELLEKLADKDPKRVLKASELKRLSGKLGANCGAGSRSITIGPDGDIRPCFLVNKKSHRYKNIIAESLSNALAGAPLEFFRTLEPPSLEICLDCQFNAYCFGCIARPLLAWDRAKKSGLKIECLWDRETGFSEELGFSM